MRSQFAEAALPRGVFAGVLDLINGLWAAARRDGFRMIGAHPLASRHVTCRRRDVSTGEPNLTMPVDKCAASLLIAAHKEPQPDLASENPFGSGAGRR